MSDIAIRVDNLSKAYRISHLAQGQRSRYKTLQEEIVGLPRRAWQAVSSAREEHETVWALRDVSFEVREGDVVGIIGRNGAGKSTLLKILSRITEPTSGQANLYGRVGSLLEVGTGFHPELTGRENVYLSGAVLGMRRSEIARRFDEIVAFSGVEQFIDTPVKRFSSGMYMRLAFSVAAHLEPEILIVDEVLAVGDAEFQKKSLGKMGDVAKSGRTVLFVSHQMNAVQALCNVSIHLSQGCIKQMGKTTDVVAAYVKNDSGSSVWEAAESSARLDNPYFTPSRFALVDEHLHPLQRSVGASERVGVLIEGSIGQISSSLTVGFAVYAAGGELLFWSLNTDKPPAEWLPLRIGVNSFVSWIPPHLLNEGSYRVEMIASLHFQRWLVQPGINAPLVSLTVQGGLSESPHWIQRRPGLLGPILDYTLIEAQAAPMVGRVEAN
jgi:lipopolysaccharide transport system ATP-binding protein